MAKLELDKDLIRELAELLEETGLSEIEIALGDARVRVARGGTPVTGLVALPAAGAEHDTRPAGPPDTAADRAAARAGPPGAVTSPMVGTLYFAPEPGATPFIRLGDTVEQGQTLFIVEAMKTMNPIPAPRSGRVGRILVRDGAPVEFGEILVILE